MDSPASHRISVPGRTQVPDGSRWVFAYGTVTLSGWLSHTILLADCLLSPCRQALQPRSSKLKRFRLFPFRSPLLGEYSLFLWILRCFSSPGALHQPMYSTGDTGGLRQWISPFGNPRIEACSRLSEAYRSDPRPSSALDAKASTISP